MANDKDAPIHPEVDEAKEKVAEVSAEEAALKDKWSGLSELAQKLVVSDQGLRQLVGAMVASRQLYAMALHDLDFRLEDNTSSRSNFSQSGCGTAEEITGEECSLLKEIFISSAATQAAHPFEESDLLTGFRDTVIPWMESVSSAHNEKEARVVKEEYQAKEKERREKSISLGLGLMPEEEDILNRDRSLILVGWSPVLSYVVAKVIDHVLSSILDFHQVIHLAKTPRQTSDHRLLELGGKAWGNCARTNASWNKIFVTQYLEQLVAPIDLFVVSDLSAANVGSTFQSVMSVSAEAQKRLRKWATEMGAAMIGCIPLPEQKRIDLNTPEWEKLRMFTRLRLVTTEIRSDGNYDIIVGRAGRIENVSKDEIEVYNPSDIIKP